MPHGSPSTSPSSFACSGDIGVHFRRGGRPRGWTLHDLSDRELMDIGLTRSEIDCIAPERAIERLRDSTRTLWGRGAM